MTARFIIACLILLTVKDAFTQCNNLDFEATPVGQYTSATGVSGWTVGSQIATSNCNISTAWASGSSEFAIVSTPILNIPNIGYLGYSPLGGTKVAVLNNTTANGTITRLQTTIAVTNANSLLQYAYAGLLQDGNHICCDQSFLKIVVKDAQGMAIPCQSLAVSASGSNCPNGAIGFTVTNNTTWTNWKNFYADLSPYVNTTISFEIIVGDCAYGDHYGTLFFDAKCSAPFMWNCYCVGTQTISNPVFYCSGSNQAILYTPLGYSSYTWVAPPGSPPIPPSQSTLSTLTVTNPVVGSVYTVNLISWSGCLFVSTATIIPTQVSIMGIGSNPTCLGGTGGSATVAAIGSGEGYNYTWINSSNNVVGTGSMITNLSPGSYTVLVTAAGNSSTSCGTSTAVTTVSVAPTGTITTVKPFCGNEAYFNINGGSNFQWYYSSLTPVPSTLGGTSPNFTVDNASHLSSYWLSYINPQGCKDSIKFILFQQTPGSLSVSNISWTCPGESSGTALVNMIPMTGTTPGYNTFSVLGDQIPTPYTASLGPTSSNQFSLSGLSAGQYTATAFDGSCKFSTTFAVIPYTFNFNLSPSGSTTVCAGQNIAAGISFSIPPSPSQYTYTWSPNQFLIGNNPHLLSTIITPSTPLGSSNTIVYTVAVTPSIVNCPLVKTFTLTIQNPISPTVNLIPPLCKNQQYTISTNPPGGTFLNHPAIDPFTGIINTAFAPVGNNAFSYSSPGSSCVATSASFQVLPLPILNVSGNLNVCNGNSTTLTASGANAYFWSNGQTGSVSVVTPTAPSVYTVVGIDANNCTSVLPFNVSVIPSPTILIHGPDIVCAWQTKTIIATGANTYTWSTGKNTPYIVITPTTTTSYTVTGTGINSCMGATVFVLNVIPIPTLQISGPTKACRGQLIKLTASGASTYTWTEGNTGSELYLMPLVDTIYSVIGTDVNTNCVSKKKEIWVEVMDCSSVTEKTLSSGKIKIYPNPSGGLIYVDTETETHIVLYNSEGKIILETTIKEPTKTNLPPLEKGIYLIWAKTMNETRVSKLIVE